MIKRCGIASQGGFLTIDFMLAMVVTIGCMLLLLQVSLSFVTAELAQYVVYAAARAQSAGDVTKADQISAGEKKYKALLNNRDIAAGFLIPENTIKKVVSIGDHQNIYVPASGFDGTSDAGLPSWGARTQITLKRLSFIPFLGSLSESGSDFDANVSGLMFREPSNQECREFFQVQRYNEILSRDSRFSQANKGNFLQAYVAMEDSGC
ncbi:MAG: hypothetical protein RJB66_2213 [Pseudomonadota bacterium]|jgi:hypothetical protein